MAVVNNLLRKTGVGFLGDVPWGTHLCQFYKTREGLLEILVPYFKAGLENNEFCMWVTSEPLKAADAKRALKRAVPDLDSYIKKGQIEILDYFDWYALGGSFDADRVLQAWADKEKLALKNGFDGLRLSGNTFWLEKKDWASFTAYERAINGVIGQHRILALCVYSLDQCGANEIVDVVSNHELTLMQRNDEWEVVQSAEYKRLEESSLIMGVQFENLFNQSPIGIEIYDAKGVLRNANKACLDIFGVDNIAAVQGFKLFEDPNITDDAKKELHQGKVVKYEALFDFEKVKKSKLYKTTKSGLAYLDVGIVPLRLNESTVVGYLVQVQDVTQRKMAEEQLKQHKERLEDLVKERTAELTVVNQQLRQEMVGHKKDEEKIQSQLNELKRWQEVTLGREGRILELKYEVNELAERLGEPPRYKSTETE